MTLCNEVSDVPGGGRFFVDCCRARAFQSSARPHGHPSEPPRRELRPKCDSDWAFRSAMTFDRLSILSSFRTPSRYNKCVCRCHEPDHRDFRTRVHQHFVELFAVTNCSGSHGRFFFCVPGICFTWEADARQSSYAHAVVRGRGGRDPRSLDQHLWNTPCLQVATTVCSSCSRCS
jgi:hypothetical protein